MTFADDLAAHTAHFARLLNLPESPMPAKPPASGQRINLVGAALHAIDREIADCERGQPYRLALLAVFRDALTIGDLEAICHSMSIHIEQMDGDLSVPARAIVNECDRLIDEKRAWLARSGDATREARVSVIREITLQEQVRARWLPRLSADDGAAS